VHTAERYSELCIVSGDHAFGNLALAARRAGMNVRVVAPHAGLSTALRVYADTAVLLPESGRPLTAASGADVAPAEAADALDHDRPLAA